MVTECLYCVKPKDFNCQYCGDPICIMHVIIDVHMNKFCNLKCSSLWRQRKQREKEDKII